MRLLTYLVLSCVFESCIKSSSEKALKSTVARYSYVVSQQSPVYSKPSTKSASLPDLMPGDTIDILENHKKNRWNVVDNNGLVGYAYKPNLLSIKDKIPSKISTVWNSANDLKGGFGVGFGYGTERAFQIEALYKLKRHMFRLGYVHQYNGQLGKLKGSRLSNYGTKVIDSNTYFVTFLAGYDFWLTNKLAIGIDGCIGSNGAYKNYSDKRFKAGGYHMITSSEFASGVGGQVNFLSLNSLCYLVDITI